LDRADLLYEFPQRARGFAPCDPDGKRRKNHSFFQNIPARRSRLALAVSFFDPFCDLPVQVLL